MTTHNQLASASSGSPEFVIDFLDMSSCEQYINNGQLAPVCEDISLQQNILDSSAPCVDMPPPPQQTMQHLSLPQYPQQVPGIHLILGDQQHNRASEYQHLDQQQMFQNYLMLVNPYLHVELGRCPWPQPEVPPLYQFSEQHIMAPHHYNIHSHQAQPRQIATMMSFSLSPALREELKEEMEKLKQFAQKFKTKHEGLGYTCEVLSQQLHIRYGVDLTSDRVARFEAGQLDLQEMHALKCYMEWWLLDIVRAEGGDIKTIKELSRELTQQMVKKKCTCIQKEQKQLLEAEFARNSYSD